MVTLPPEEQERAVWQYLTRTLSLLEETETTPEKLDELTMRRTLIRLAGLTQALTQPHKINEYGQCLECRKANQATQSMGCAVLLVAALYLMEPLPVVWWQILTCQGRTLTLDEIRTWLDATDTDEN